MNRDFGYSVEGKKVFFRAPISRRRLLKLAAYSVPLVTAVNAAAPVRVLAQSPGECVPCNGSGLWLDLYDNPWWRGPQQGVGVEAPCHGAPWYPLPQDPNAPRDPTFSARWVGALCISVPGIYVLRLRGVNWAQGIVFDPTSENFHVFGDSGLTLNLSCGDYPLDLYLRHTTQNLSDSEVHFECIPPGGSDWQCVPVEHLHWA